jgi:hypothetical protein
MLDRLANEVLEQIVAILTHNDDLRNLALVVSALHQVVVQLGPL